MNPAPERRTARIIETELRACRARLMQLSPHSREYRALILRRRALGLELALTTGALALGSL